MAGKETGKKRLAPRDKQGRFIKGNTGGGRPKGSLDKRTAPFRATIDQALPDILSAVIDQAKAGDMTACKIIIDRSLPTIRPVEVSRPLPIVGNTLTEQAESIIAGIGAGTISTDEATRLLNALAGVARITELDDLTRRIEKLEASS